MQKINFRNCDLDQLDEIAGLSEVIHLAALDSWVKTKWNISDFEKNILMLYQNALISNLHAWNEMELALNFIGPIMLLVDFSTNKYNAFNERPLSAVINGVEFSGNVDGLIASGKRTPKKPYFCMQEYKKEKDPDGDPYAQVLGAMLVAQTLNQDSNPIYGAYIKGNEWFFLVLEGTKYARSLGHNALKEEIFDIFSILKGLKQIIDNQVNNNHL
jgi:hypothetical protein